MMLKSVLEVNRMCSIKKEKKGYAFAWGAAEFPWDKDKDVTSVPCLDAENSVVFELQRDRTKFLHIE
jgi:hypothetical protein